MGNGPIRNAKICQSFYGNLFLILYDYKEMIRSKVEGAVKHTPGVYLQENVKVFMETKT